MSLDVGWLLSLFKTNMGDKSFYRTTEVHISSAVKVMRKLIFEGFGKLMVGGIMILVEWYHAGTFLVVV